MSKILLCIVTGERGDATLLCSLSLLRFQTSLASAGERIMTDLHFVHTLNDALNLLWATPDAVGCVAVQSCIGFDADFALRAMRSGRQVVAGAYPLPTLDWKRVASQPAGEDPSHWGIVYNATPVSGEDADGYVPVDPATAKLGLVWVRRPVLESIAARCPAVLTADRSAGAFALPALAGGRLVSADARFLELYGGAVAVDARSNVVSSGPVEFGGAVGSRKILR